MQPKSVSNIPQNHFDENKNKGWVKLYRSSLDSYLRKDANCFAVWCYLLMVVDREDKFSGGQQIRFKGEFRGSIAFIADWLDLSRRTVRRCVDKLLAAQSITLQTHNKGCIIKIVNWDAYQSNLSDDVTPSNIKVTSNAHQNAQPTPTIQEVKKVTKKERENLETVNPQLSVSGTRRKSKLPPPLSGGDVKLGKEWLTFAKEKLPFLKQSETTFAEEIYKARKAVGLTDEQMAALFRFITEDDFWKTNAYSPAGLLRKSKNGLRKIDNILAKLRKERYSHADVMQEAAEYDAAVARGENPPKKREYAF